MPNPYSTPKHVAPPDGNVRSKWLIFSVTSCALLITVLLAGLLVASAIYNVSLWEDGKIPSNSLSRHVVSLQLVLILLSIAMGAINFIAVLVHLALKNWKHAAFCLIGTAVSSIGIVFTMIYDDGSIFFQ